jgi:hypothetical protein
MKSLRDVTKLVLTTATAETDLARLTAGSILVLELELLHAQMAVLRAEVARLKPSHRSADS